MRKLCSAVGIIATVFLLVIASEAKEQAGYSYTWDGLSSETFSHDSGPIYIGDGAEYRFSVNAPSNARFIWNIDPLGGLVTKLGGGGGFPLGQKTDLHGFIWQAPMSGEAHKVEVRAWLEGEGEGDAVTLEGEWRATLAIPFLDVYLKDGVDEHHDEVYLPAVGGVQEQVFAFVGVAEAGAGLEDIKVWWEDGGSSENSAGTWSPQEQRSNAAGDASTTFTVGESAEAGDYQVIKAEIKTAPGAGGVHVTDKNAPKINIFEVDKIVLSSEYAISSPVEFDGGGTVGNPCSGSNPEQSLT